MDIIGDAGPGLYAKAVDIAAKDPNTDGLLVILTPQAMTDPTATAEQLKPYAHIEGKPILASWMGADAGGRGRGHSQRRATFRPSNIPTAPPGRFITCGVTAKTCARFTKPPPLAHESNEDIDRAQGAPTLMLKASARPGRTILTEFESKQLLAAYGIPTVETHIARTEADAVKHADAPGLSRSCSNCIRKPSRTRPTWAACN